MDPAHGARHDPTEKAHDSHTRRTYSIVAVIGHGGFGKVYRATMEGADGFRKDVAIKLMREDTMPDDALMRFRDEARILGLIRDRAIVSIDSPTRLNGRLAVVMEYIDGASAATLMKKGPFPPTVALEVIQEVARVLDKVVRHPGPDGRPLNLLHRDLKPANLQITPGGEVKVLDFGIARATFDARESRTVSNVAGTVGYLAPERLVGVEAPSGDIYSLGVVLHVLTTNEKALTHGVFAPRGAVVARTPLVLAVLELARQMYDADPAARPTARQVEDRCQDLRVVFAGPTLRTWAEANVPITSKMEPDELVGVTLSETIATVAKVSADVELPGFPRVVGWRRTGARVAAVALSLAVMVGLLVITAAALATGLHLARDASEPMPAIPAAITLVLPKLVAPPPASVLVAPAVNVEAVPAPEASTLARRAPRPAVVAATLAIEPIAAPPPAIVAAGPTGPTWKVTFASVPGGADVLIDGILIGTAPVLNHELPAGSFLVTMITPTGERIAKTIETGDRAPRRYVWDQQGGGTWNSY